jgi:hypothetical protein
MKRRSIVVFALCLAWHAFAFPAEGESGARVHHVSLRLFRGFEDAPSGVFMSGYSLPGEAEAGMQAMAEKTARAFGLKEALPLACVSFNVREGRDVKIPVACSENGAARALMVKLRLEGSPEGLVCHAALWENRSEIFRTGAEVTRYGRGLFFGARSSGRPYILSVTFQNAFSGAPPQAPSARTPPPLPSPPSGSGVPASFSYDTRQEVLEVEAWGEGAGARRGDAQGVAKAWRGKGMVFVHFR